MNDILSGFIGVVPVALIFGWLGNMIFKRVERIFDSSTDHEIRIRILEEHIKRLTK